MLSSRELLCAQQAGSDLPMLHAARMQVKQAATKHPVTKPQTEIMRPTSKNVVQATGNLLPIGSHVMYKSPPSKLWYPAVITNIL